MYTQDDEINRLRALANELMLFSQKTASDFKYSVNDLTSVIKEQQLKFENLLEEQRRGYEEVFNLQQQEIQRLNSLVPFDN
jgi:hypothetical protein